MRDKGVGPQLRSLEARLRRTLDRHMHRAGRILVVAGAAVVVAFGLYQVEPGEVGIVRTFGAVTDRTDAGLRFRWPLVQQVDVVNVENIRRLEVGFRGDTLEPLEAQMLTGDENIVEARMIVQYRVSDPERYLFRLKAPDKALHATAEVALRGVVGRTNVDEVITSGRASVQADVMLTLQRLMDQYDSGLSVTEVRLQAVDPPDQVRDAFHDVVRAREEREQLIDEARGYQEDAIPRAKGQARQAEREAEAYREERVLRANGDTRKFEVMLVQYSKATRVTRRRLYLETMERTLSSVEDTIVVDRSVPGSASPVLPLDGGGLGQMTVRMGQGR
jgi:membrane protease subunit HflK